MKHTPGPWHHCTLTSDGRAVTIYAHTQTYECHKYIARVYGGGALSRSTRERNANVKLIAAAPKLLEALEATASVIRNILTDSQLDTRTPCGCTVRQWAIAVDEALAAAKGEDDDIR